MGSRTLYASKKRPAHIPRMPLLQNRSRKPLVWPPPPVKNGAQLSRQINWQTTTWLSPTTTNPLANSTSLLRGRTGRGHFPQHAIRLVGGARWKCVPTARRCAEMGAWLHRHRCNGRGIRGRQQQNSRTPRARMDRPTVEARKYGYAP